MASQNRLLGMTYPDIPPIGEDIPSNSRVPAWRYHKDCPKGKLVKRDDELDTLDAEGWVDHPGKLSKLPGLEQFYQEESTEEKPNAEEMQTQTEGEVSVPLAASVVDNVVSAPEIRDNVSPVGTGFVLPPKIEPTEDELKAAALKAESDRVEQMRLKAEERAILGPETFMCDVEGCGKVFDRPRGLRMHKFAAHKPKKGVVDAGQGAPH
jgi:hypothetical protein